MLTLRPNEALAGTPLRAEGPAPLVEAKPCEGVKRAKQLAISLQNVLPLVANVQLREWRGELPGKDGKVVWKAVTDVLKQDRTNVGAGRYAAVLMRANGMFDQAERLIKKCISLVERAHASGHKGRDSGCVFPRCRCNPMITSHYAELVSDLGHILLHKARSEARRNPEEAKVLLQRATERFLQAVKLDPNAIGGYKGLSYAAGLQGRKEQRDGYLARAERCR